MNKEKLKDVLFALVGIVIITISSMWLVSNWEFLYRSETTDGSVVSLNAGGSHPQISFTTKTGEIIEYSQNGLIWGYRTGQKTVVLYDPQNPQDCIVKSFGALWGFPVLLLILGIIFLSSTISSTKHWLKRSTVNILN